MTSTKTCEQRAAERVREVAEAGARLFWFDEVMALRQAARDRADADALWLAEESALLLSELRAMSGDLKDLSSAVGAVRAEVEMHVTFVEMTRGLSCEEVDSSDWPDDPDDVD